MPQISISRAHSLLKKAGYSVRKSRKRQNRLIVVREGMTASLAVLNGCVAQERVTRLLDLAESAASLAIRQH